MSEGPRRPAAGLVEAVVLTHRHAHHNGTAAEVSGATGAPVLAGVLAGVLDAAVLRHETLPLPPRLAEDEVELHAAITAGGAVLEPPLLPGVQDARTDDPALRASGVRVLTTGGHTPGSVALHLPAARALLTGDLARTDDGGGLVRGRSHNDPATVGAALGTLAGLDPLLVGVGHGAPVVAGAAAALRAAASRPPARASTQAPAHVPPSTRPSREDRS